MITATAARLFGPRAALFTAGLVLLPPFLLARFLWLLTENLLFPLIALALTAAISCQRSAALGPAVLGLLLGAIAIVHPGWQLFILFALLALRLRAFLIGATTSIGVVVAVAAAFHLSYPGQPWQYARGNAGYGGGAAWTFYVGSRVDTGGRPTSADYEAAETGATATPTTGAAPSRTGVPIPSTRPRSGSARLFGRFCCFRG